MEEMDYFDYCLSIDITICDIEKQASALVRECRANADAMDAFEENAANNGYRIR